VIALVACVLILLCLGVTQAAADDSWVLWQRSLDIKGQPRGPWHKKQEFDAERWCKGAMTTAINQALGQVKQQGLKAQIAEYECFPRGVEPPAPKP